LAKILPDDEKPSKVLSFNAEGIFFRELLSEG
jgi:hypothetical protein